MIRAYTDVLKQNIALSSTGTLQEWRERVLDGVLPSLLIFWLLALLAGAINLIRTSRWEGVSDRLPVMLAIYVLVATAAGVVTFRRQFSFTLRSGAILFFLYTLGAIALVLNGLGSDGRLFLLTFVAATALLFDWRRSLIALAVSLLTIAVAAWLLSSGYVTIPVIQAAISRDLFFWLSSGAVFLLLSFATILAITYIIRSLDRSLADSQKEHRLLSTLLDTSGALIIIFDPTGRIVRFNRACEQLTGYACDEVADRYVWDLFLTPEGADLMRTVFEELHLDPSPKAYESYWLTAERERRLIAWSSTALTDSDGAVEYVISTGIDITAHKQAEAEREHLLAAEREQRLLAEILTGVTLALTSQTRPTAVLDEILRQVQRIVPFKSANIMLLEGEDLRSARWQGYQSLGSQEAVFDVIHSHTALPLASKVIETRRPVVIDDTREDSRWVVLEETAWIRSHMMVPIVHQDHVLGLLRLDGNMPGEFTVQDAERLQPLANAAAIALENARLHQETRHQAQRMGQILDTVQEGILLLNAQNRIELANPAAQAYLEVLAGAQVGDVLAYLSDRPMTKLLEPPPEGLMWHEVMLKSPRRVFEVAAQSMEEGSGLAGGWVLVLRDMTEERRQQQYLQAQERLAMVGQLAAGIAHDFNNIMTVIILYAQMLLKAPDLPANIQPRMATVFQQARRAANLISQILDFSRRSVMERRHLNLVPFLKELMKLMQRTLPENITLDLVYDDEEYIVGADLTRLQQAVMNLAVNARDAMPNGGTLSISLNHLTLKPGDKPPLPDILPGNWLTLKVADTGTGIRPEDLPHIFEPFFTTKPPDKGTGLGLAQVYGIVKQHEGYIDVSSEVSKGTEFTIYLPALILSDVAAAEPEEEAPLAGRGETILVVEDDQITREAVCAILETLNYHVLEAADGAQALRLFESHLNDIALVLSDMVMPMMSGSVLYTKLREKKSDIKMVVITGYPFEKADQALLSRKTIPWVQKPFEVGQIATAIQEALAS